MLIVDSWCVHSWYVGMLIVGMLIGCRLSKPIRPIMGWIRCHEMMR